MKVRIRKTPVEREMDGIKLDRLAPGAVRDVSTSLASWLIVEGYADPEMRSVPRDFEPDDPPAYEPRAIANDRRRRNS